jgi:DNA-binding GntR family transcriptional regulator
MRVRTAAVSRSADEFRVEEVRPLRDRIAAAIRGLIMDGRIHPGGRLAEPDLARRLGVSRTPLREALMQLESEGFVVVTPRRGAVVSDLSATDAVETYQVKGALEALAARLACDRLSDETLQSLRQIHERMARFAGARVPDSRVILQLNTEFHQALSDGSGNAKLSNAIRVLRGQALRYNFIYLSVLSHLAASMKEHEAILKALQKRDAEAVARLVEAHGASACKALCAFIERRSAEHRSAEHRSTEDRSTEDRSAEDRSTEDRSAEDRSTEDRSTEHQSNEHRSAEDRSAEHRSAEDRSAEDRSTEHHSTAHQSNEHHSNKHHTAAKTRTHS